MAGINYNSMEGKDKDESFREKGEAAKKSAPKYKDTCNPNESVPKLPQLPGAE